MSELFDEVNEEVRREQLKRFWDRYSFLIIGLAVLIIAAVGGWRYYQFDQTKRAAQAGSAFEAAALLSEQKKHAEAEAAFQKLATDGPTGYRALARLQAAAEVATRDSAAAVTLYDGIAADAAVGPLERDLARIRAASLLVDTAPLADLRTRLEPLTPPDATYRHTARELLALAAWRASDAPAARQWLDMIAADSDTPSGIRSRAEALQALLPATARS